MNQEKHAHYDCIEDFLFDDDFMDLSANNDVEEINRLITQYKDKENLIRDAFTLLQSLKIDQEELSKGQLEEDWTRIQKTLSDKNKAGRKQKIKLASLVGIAASLVLVAITFFYQETKISAETENLLSILSDIDTNINEVQIISGGNQVNIENEKTINQTAEGNLIVDDDKQFESVGIETEYLTIVVPNGRRTSVNFSDGTKVWINSGSKIVYPKVFKQDKREIVVDGEIYIDVAKDQNRPFIVHTKRIDIKVLGTKFNVSAYSEDSNGSIVLVEGAVEVTKENEIKANLTPRQGFFFDKNTEKIEANLDIYSFIGWIDGVMKVSGEPLDRIFKKLSRHYRINIECKRDFSKEKYKGKISLKKPIDELLDDLSYSTSFTYTVEEDKIIIE